MPLVPLHEWEGKQVVIKEWSGTRSEQASRYFHGPVVKGWMAYMGYAKEEMKYLLKHWYGPKITIKIKHGGQTIELPKSTADYTSKEMCELVQTCIIEGAKHGIYIAPPPYDDSFSPIPNE